MATNTKSQTPVQAAIAVLETWTGYSDRLKRQDTSLLEALADGPKTRAQIAEVVTVPEWSFRRLATGKHGPKGRSQSEPLITREGKGEEAVWKLVEQAS